MSSQMSKQRSGFWLVRMIAFTILESLCSAGCSPDAAAPPPPPLTAPRPRQSQTLALSADGTLLAVVNPDADSLSIIDTAKRQLRREIRLGERPRQSASGRYEPALGPRAVDLSADGRLAYVACQESGQLLTVDTSTGATVSALTVGPEPAAVLLHPSAAAVYVSIYQSSEVLRLPLGESGLPDASAIVRRPTTDRPFSLALDESGATLYVTRFLLQPGLDLFDAATLQPKGQGAIADVPPRGDRLLAHGAARGVYSAAVRPGASGQVWLGHLLLATDTAQPELDFETTVFPAVSVRDRSGGPVEVLSVDSRKPGVDGAFGDIVSGPRALAFTPDGGLALVVDMSSEDVLALDAEQRVGVELVRPLPGDLPQGIVVSPDGRHAYVDERASSDVAVLAIAADWRSRAVGRVVVDGPPIARLDSADPMPAELRLGQRLFYSANSAEFPLTQNFWVACASCHLEGRSDAVVWLFTPGPRDTPSNAGGVLGTGFLMRNALRNQVAQYDEIIRLEQGGDVNASRPQDQKLLAALSSYVNYAIPLPHSTEVDPVTRQPSAAAQRGQAVFARLGCSNCHNGPRLTDSGSGNPGLDLSGQSGPILLHDVGTCVRTAFTDQSVPAVDGTLRPDCAFDTPGLLGVSDSPPYFHDGSAATLGEVVDYFVRFFAISPPPTSQERADLIAYLRSL
jgi:DNA-binding beta-propeller fold protein YncE/mono/diheme cytochrome c family protein